MDFTAPPPPLSLKLFFSVNIVYGKLKCENSQVPKNLNEIVC